MGKVFTGSGGSSQATSGGIRKSLFPSLTGLLDPAKRGDALGSLSLDPSQTAAQSAAFGQYSDPNYLDVASNPYTKNLIAALTDNSNTNLSSGLANLKSQFAAQYGQTGAGASSPLAGTEAQAITQSNKDLNNTLAGSLFQQLQHQQGLQLEGLNSASQFNMLPAHIMALLAPLFSKSKGATPSPLSSIGDVIGGVGGAAGGAGALLAL